MPRIDAVNDSSGMSARSITTASSAGLRSNATSAASAAAQAGTTSVWVPARVDFGAEGAERRTERCYQSQVTDGIAPRRAGNGSIRYAAIVPSKPSRLSPCAVRFRCPLLPGCFSSPPCAPARSRPRPPSAPRYTGLFAAAARRRRRNRAPRRGGCRRERARRPRPHAAARRRVRRQARRDARARQGRRRPRTRSRTIATTSSRSPRWPTTCRR